MIAWLLGLVPHIKVAHVAMLSVWCAGLFALPLMLARHDPAVGRDDYIRIRKATHYGYTWVTTPAAVLAIASGTLLIFLRGVYVPWMFGKLIFVAGLVGFHVWVGYVIVSVAETPGEPSAPSPGRPLLLLLVPILGILTLVLSKPELGEIPMPGWLTEPRGHQLPFDVPRR